MAERTGKLDFVVGDETFQTFYTITGDLTSPVCPVVMVAGGPGISHKYMLPNADLWEQYGIPVIFYDQLGIGESTDLRHKPADFWTVELFIDELHNLVTKLGIAENFHILGHSWGGMLGVSYAAKRQPSGLKRLVLASAPASNALWEVGVQTLLRELPKEVQDILRKHEEAGTTDDPEYQQNTAIFLAKHACRINPMPEELLQSFASMEANPVVYHTMQGPSEFSITGTLKTWSIVDEIHKVQPQTLLINGYYDEARDVCMQPFFDKIDKVKWVKFMQSSHLACFEEREKYINVVGTFLTSS